VETASFTIRTNNLTCRGGRVNKFLRNQLRKRA
jgi:hypothetical protein